jgi:hypothetical protein
MGQLIVRAPAAAAPGGGTIAALLEDNSTRRINGDASTLWTGYAADSRYTGFSDSIGTGYLVGTPGSGKKFYVHFHSYGASGYNHPGGYTKSWLREGTWDSNFNRMWFAVRVGTNIARRGDGGQTFEFGTYVRDPDDTGPVDQGEHYYHLTSHRWTAGDWAIFCADAHPQYYINDPNGSVNHIVDPRYTSFGNLHYLHTLTRWYFEPVGDGFADVVISYGDIWFSKETTLTSEEFVSSMIAHYDSSGGKYVVSWASQKNVNHTFDVRYSTSDMYAAGFTSGTLAGTSTSTNNDYTGVIHEITLAQQSPGLFIAVRRQGQTNFRQIYVPHSFDGRAFNPY